MKLLIMQFPPLSTQIIPPVIYHSTLFLNILSLYSSLTVRDYVLYP